MNNNHYAIIVSFMYLSFSTLNCMEERESLIPYHLQELTSMNTDFNSTLHKKRFAELVNQNNIVFRERLKLYQECGLFCGIVAGVMLGCAVFIPLPLEPNTKATAIMGLGLVGMTTGMFTGRAYAFKQQKIREEQIESFKNSLVESGLYDESLNTPEGLLKAQQAYDEAANKCSTTLRAIARASYGTCGN